jgi:hypothetical protein
LAESTTPDDLSNRIPQTTIPCVSPLGFGAVAPTISPAAKARQRIPTQMILGKLNSDIQKLKDKMYDSNLLERKGWS